MVAGAHRPQARGLSFATWIALESGCNRTRTVPNSSGPPIGPSFGFCPFRTTARCDGSSHDLQPLADPLKRNFDDRVGDGPNRQSCSVHTLNRKSMTTFQPESSRLAPRNPLLRIARKQMRPGFLCAGLNEHRLKVRLRTPQSMVAYEAQDAKGQRLIDETALNSVIVLVVVTSILGPILTEQFGQRLKAAGQTSPPSASAVA